MKSKKQLILYAFVLMLVSFGNASAQTCFDPNFGYYNCNQEYYYYPDQGQAFATGAFFGMMLGGFGNEGYYHGHRGHEHGEHRGGGGHHH